MPFIELEPPSTRPRGQCIRRWLQPGSGSVSKAQLYLGRFMGMESAVGMCRNRFAGWALLSSPPCSSSSTVALPSSVSRFASTQPAEPAPTTT